MARLWPGYRKDGSASSPLTLLWKPHNTERYTEITSESQPGLLRMLIPARACSASWSLIQIHPMPSQVAQRSCWCPGPPFDAFCGPQIPCRSPSCMQPSLGLSQYGNLSVSFRHSVLPFYNRRTLNSSPGPARWVLALEEKQNGKLSGRPPPSRATSA